MKKTGLLTLLAAGILFIAFFSNVTLGALGNKPVLNDIQEMLMLFASSILFAVAVLQFETADSQKKS